MEQTFKIGKVTLSITADESPESPREWDNFGTMVCFHGRYRLGDEHSWESPEVFLDGLAEEYSDKLRNYDYDRALDSARPRVRAAILAAGAQPGPGEIATRASALVDHWRGKIREKVLNQHYVILPLYLYDHSGITMNTTGFSCRWDSGQVGFIYVSREKILEVSGKKKLTKKLREWAADILRAEVRTYDQYLTGDVWCADVSIDGEADESCGGYFGSDYAVLEGLDAMINTAIGVYEIGQEWVWDSAQTPEMRLARWEGWLAAADCEHCIDPEIHADFEAVFSEFRGAIIAHRKAELRSKI